MKNVVRPSESTDAASNVRFGPFELDIRAGELVKGGRRIRLQEQPLQILRMLLESPGAVVSREEIRKRLWPDDTVVEFDHSINAAVKRLRDTLRESADKPRYIETIARRGYRFIGELEAHSRAAPVPEPKPLVRADQIADPALGPAVAERWSPRGLSLFIVLGALIAVFGAGAWYFDRWTRRVAPPLRPLMRLDVEVGDEAISSSSTGVGAILSPDGTRLAYLSRSMLFTRRLDDSKGTAVPGTEGAYAPFFSPDGNWIAFFAFGKLKKVPVHGGGAIELSNTSLANGGSWGTDGNIIAAVKSSVLSRIPSQGGIGTHVTALAPGEIIHRWPQVLPGGGAVLFTAYSSMTGSEGANIEVVSLTDHRRKTLIRGGTYGRYAPTGHLVYTHNGTVLAVPFDVSRLEVRGTPMPVLEGVAYSTAWGFAQFDFSNSGTLVYRTATTGSDLVTVQLVDNEGRNRPLVPVPGNYLSPTVSPDGTRVALTSAGDIWVYELQHGAMTRLTSGGGYGNPLWSADGRFIVFRAARGIFWTHADASGESQPLLQSRNQQVPWSFTTDGKRLAFVEINQASGADLWTVPVINVGSALRADKPEVFLNTPVDERTPMISPDGRWMAYMSNESGRMRVYVQSFPDRRGKRQISTDLGGYPAWSRYGHELFFFQLGADPKLMVTPYKLQGNSFEPDTPRVWSRTPLVSFSTTRSYDPLPDGKRIVALMRADALGSGGTA